MIEINYVRKIKAPKDCVWSVITNVSEYPHWNTFVTECESTFEVGSPILMKVNLIPNRPQHQEETIRVNEHGKLLEYGIKMPFGMLSSSRKHVLKEISAEETEYQSLFRLKGFLSPLFKLTLNKQLKRGFKDMTDGIVEQAEKLSAAAHEK